MRAFSNRALASSSVPRGRAENSRIDLHRFSTPYTAPSIPNENFLDRDESLVHQGSRELACQHSTDDAQGAIHCLVESENFVDGVLRFRATEGNDGRDRLEVSLDIEQRSNARPILEEDVLEGSNLGAVKSLYLGDSDINPLFSVALAREIRYNSSLKILDLSSNSISDQGASALSAVLIANKTLESLDVASNGISQHGIACLAAGLKHNSSIKSLELSFNGFGDAGVFCLADALRKNSTLEYLGLGFNGILESGASAVSQACLMSRSLTKIELSYNAIGDFGVEILSEMLEGNPALKVLGLVSNGIGDRGAKALAKALESNSNLKVLGLSSNEISDEGAESFAEMLHINDSLQGLYLEENDIGEVGSAALAKAHKATTICSPMNVEKRLAVLMGTHRRLGQESVLFLLDALLCREIVVFCNDHAPRDVLYYPRIYQDET
eukprot:750648-Hanusia_phi.AAC.4